MKEPSEVGKDFDRYAEQWRDQDYQMESSYSSVGVEGDLTLADSVVRPGDEWGETGPLYELYTNLVAAYLGDVGTVNVLEVGAGGGRSTEVMIDVLGDRIGDYHVVDVSAGFVEVLRERIARPLVIHIVDDVVLDELPERHFDLCFSQSAWSHISLYDQYRYLRELRRVLRYEAPLCVHGLFLLGIGHDWTWNRFKRRVSQIDRRVEGVYHEFTGVSAIAEMLMRLGYNTECVASSGVIARRGEANHRSVRATLDRPISYPFNDNLLDFLITGATTRAQLHEQQTTDGAEPTRATPRLGP